MLEDILLNLKPFTEIIHHIQSLERLQYSESIISYFQNSFQKRRSWKSFLAIITLISMHLNLSECKKIVSDDFIFKVFCNTLNFLVSFTFSVRLTLFKKKLWAGSWACLTGNLWETQIRILWSPCFNALMPT